MMEWFIPGKYILDFLWLVFLLLLFGYFWRDRKDLLASKNWVKTTGHVIECEWTQSGESLWPEIEYVYYANEKEYHGHYLFLDTSHNNPNSAYARNIAYKAAISYTKNAPLEIYYDPFYPQRSALDVTIPPKLNVIIGLLGALIVLHLSVMLYPFI